MRILENSSKPEWDKNLREPFRTSLNTNNGVCNIGLISDPVPQFHPQGVHPGQLPHLLSYVIVVVQLLSCFWLLRPHGLQHARLLCPPLSPSLLKFMSIESVILSNHLSLSHPLLLCLQSFTPSGSLTDGFESKYFIFERIPGSTTKKGRGLIKGI